MLWTRRRLLLGLAATALGHVGCSIGPRSLERDRLRYNEAVKRTSEEELLLNIVRLRYTDTPSSLAVSAIAAQYELTKNFQITPFFVASGAEVARSYAAVLPQQCRTHIVHCGSPDDPDLPPPRIVMPAPRSHRPSH